MFSGIIEEAATVVALKKDKGNLNITLTCSFANELKADQSVSHNGVCLTVVDVRENTYSVTAVQETLECSNLGELQVGDKVNVERSMLLNGRFDGHIVQGHVDQTAICTDIIEADGSWYYTFEYEVDERKAKRGYIAVDKGSIAVNGVSLTVVEPTDNSFKVAIIPSTHDITNFSEIKKGSVVNIEFDIVGKYISRLLNLDGVNMCDDFLSFVTTRQSDRAYDASRKVEKEKLNRILQAARLAPSATNSQPWHIIVVDDPEVRNKIADATLSHMPGIYRFSQQAPVHLVIVQEKGNVFSNIGGYVVKKDFAQIDLGILAAHIVLAAHAEGLGSCIVGWLDEGKMKKVLSIPDSKRVWLDILIGYSTQPLRAKKRKDLEEIVSYNKY